MTLSTSTSQWDNTCSCSVMLGLIGTATAVTTLEAPEVDLKAFTIAGSCLLKLAGIPQFSRSQITIPGGAAVASSLALGSFRAGGSAEGARKLVSVSHSPIAASHTLSKVAEALPCWKFSVLESKFQHRARGLQHCFCNEVFGHLNCIAV